LKQLAWTIIILGLATSVACDRNNRPDASTDSPGVSAGEEGDEAEAMAATGAAGMPGAEGVEGDPTTRPMPPVGTEIDVPPETWKALLTDEQFHILREEGTERAFTGPLLKVKDPGTWHCAGCNAPLFKTETKFESGTGWPSFYAPIEGRVGEREDKKFGMSRTEVHCDACEGHLGHVFPDGPEPTGLRYCLNSVSVNFRPAALPDPPVGVTPELKSTQ
jgi:peptide-methionine (R)-S-oxide reductase